MEDSEVASGLFAIQLSSDDEGDDNNNNKNSSSNAQDNAKADRTGQTEEQFQEVKRTYRVKVESGELYKQLSHPLTSSSSLLPPSQSSKQLIPKPQAQALLHAVEELYFLRRYADGADFVRRILGGGGGGDDTSDNEAGVGEGGPRLDEDTRKTLRYYQKRCQERSQE